MARAFILLLDLSKKRNDLKPLLGLETMCQKWTHDVSEMDTSCVIISEVTTHDVSKKFDILTL
jgi:hypothetical protein